MGLMKALSKVLPYHKVTQVIILCKERNTLHVLMNAKYKQERNIVLNKNKNNKHIKVPCT